MLLDRTEMTFDFGGAKLRPEQDRALLAWIFNQFLYGEVTGIQCGHWLYNAPSLEAARFLAKQAIEEFQHIDNFLRCLAFLGETPERPNKLVRFLATGMMPSAWEEHVSQEMMFGEGFAAMCFYALADTIEHDEISAILNRAVKQEERHVEFGENETMRLIQEKPRRKRRLLGINMVSLWAVKRLARAMTQKLDNEHPVLKQLPEFLDATLRAAELRLKRANMIDRPLAEYSTATKLGWVLEAYGHKALRGLVRFPLRLFPFLHKPERLTETYLEDPAVRSFLLKAQNDAKTA